MQQVFTGVTVMISDTSCAMRESCVFRCHFRLPWSGSSLPAIFRPYFGVMLENVFTKLLCQLELPPGQ